MGPRTERRFLFEIREAALPIDLETVRGLWRDYLVWGNRELEARHGFRFPIDQMLDQDIATINKFQPPDGRILLAFVGGEAVGIGCLRRVGPKTAEIKRMYVTPSQRRAGLGRAMLNRLVDEARAGGYRWIKLDSADFMTAAHALYRAAGFAVVDPYPESEIPNEYKPYWVFMERALA
jgi:GNAT superfamily N-acetyltransferase